MQRLEPIHGVAPFARSPWPKPMTDAATPETSESPEAPDDAVVDLDDVRAVDTSLTGGKASALARVRRAGIETLAGSVLTTRFCEKIDAGEGVRGHPAIHEVLGALQGCDRLIARSSSVAEDQAEGSKAGRFESVVEIEGRSALEDAVQEVLDSRHVAGAAGKPISVLVQPMIEPTVGGVLFGVDPVSGRSDRRVVTAVEGQPGPLVSGEVGGARFVLDAYGDLVSSDTRAGPDIDADTLRQLADLGERTSDLLGGPQDIEWAVIDDTLVLLQSRPVTTEIRGVPSGPVYGPGPVAETFPEPLTTLERDLWVPPLNTAVAEALRLSRSASDDELDGPPLVVTVDGYAAIDLERTGELAGEEGHERLGVVGRIRRLRSAWRVGRLRNALPSLGLRIVRRVDEDLETLPPLSSMTDRQLAAVLARTQDALHSVHAHEILMGLLGGHARSKLTGASVALRVLVEARTDGRSDAEIVAQSPVVLALTPPRVGPFATLPDSTKTPDIAPRPQADVDGEASQGVQPRTTVVPEALRLRARWLQELSGRAAWELGERLQRSGQLDEPQQVRYLTLDELSAIVTRRATVLDTSLAARAAPAPEPTPLPARFQVSDLGRPVPHPTGEGSGGGTGAGGGTGSGPVSHDTDDPPRGSVLVVSTLTPGLGPLLPRLTGLVAETGSVLAHLAILAREAGVATVVAHAHATTELQEGQTVTVDGIAGTVTVDDPDDDTDDGGTG